MKDFPLYRSIRACVGGTLAIAAPLLFLSLSPLLGLYTVMGVLFLLPTALCTVGLVCGLVPMAVGAAAGLWAMFHLAGAPGLISAAVYVLPILAAFMIVVSLRVPFWKGCAAMIGVHVAALAGVYLFLQARAGGDLYHSAAAAAVTALENWEMGDSMLYQFYAMGLISLPENLSENMVLPVLGGYTLSAAAREDLLLSVRTLVQSALTSLVPNLIVSQSILGGVACLLLPLRFGFVAAERRAFLREGPPEEAEEDAEDESKKPGLDFPDLGMPPLSQWHLPRGVGWQVGAALIAGYLLRGSGNASAAIAGIILHAAATSVFTIQGLALVNFMQKARGTRRFWRIALPIVLLLFSVLSLLGILDQIVNIRGLRKPREPKEE